MAQQPLAYLFPEFLESHEARPIRILSEYLEPLRRFKEQKIQDTVVFFGSARVNSRERAERALVLFSQIVQKWPKSQYAEDSKYKINVTRDQLAVLVRQSLHAADGQHGQEEQRRGEGGNQPAALVLHPFAQQQGGEMGLHGRSFRLACC